MKALLKLIKGWGELIGRDNHFSIEGLGYASKQIEPHTKHTENIFAINQNSSRLLSDPYSHEFPSFLKLSGSHKGRSNEDKKGQPTTIQGRELNGKDCEGTSHGSLLKKGVRELKRILNWSWSEGFKEAKTKTKNGRGGHHLPTQMGTRDATNTKAWLRYNNGTTEGVDYATFLSCDEKMVKDKAERIMHVRECMSVLEHKCLEQEKKESQACTRRSMGAMPIDFKW